MCKKHSFYLQKTKKNYLKHYFETAREIKNFQLLCF